MLTHDAIRSFLIGLTPTQADFVRHRLEVPDAVADCFGQTEGYEHWHEDEIYDTCETLAAIIDRRSPSVPLVNLPLPLVAEVLVDCCDGSTWVAASSWDADNRTVARLVRTAESVAAKVSALVGRTVVAAVD